MKNTSKLLIAESPLQVLPTLAVALGGSDPAIILQQIHYWLRTSKHQIEGRHWIYNTIEQWKEQFPWLSERTIRRTLDRLEERGLIKTGYFSPDRWDRTKWYSIDYESLDALGDRVEAASGHSVQIDVDIHSTSIGTSGPDVIQETTPGDYTTDLASVAFAPSAVQTETESVQQAIGFDVPTKSVPEEKPKKESRASRTKSRPGFPEAVRGIFETLPIRYSGGEMGKAANFVLDQIEMNGWDTDTLYDDIVALYKSMIEKEFWQNKEIHPMALAKQYRFWRANVRQKPQESATPTETYRPQPLFVKR